MENGHVLLTEVVDDETFRTFVSAHESQLRAAGVPQCKWRTLCYKLQESIFDAGDDFMYAQEVLENAEEKDAYHWRVYTKSAMTPDDEDHIYLIDHAWTYTWESAKRILEMNHDLVERMCSLMNISLNDHPVSDLISSILKEMWRYNNSYILHSGSQAVSTIRCWFIMDEFGSRINHSENPTFQIVTFFYTFKNCTFSLLFPKISVTVEDEVTCEFPRFSSTLSEDMQKAVKYPWEPCDFSAIDFISKEPHPDYFASGRNIEILPSLAYCEELQKKISAVKEKDYLKVYTEYPEIGEHLTHSRFKVTVAKNQANIFWFAERQTNYKELADRYPNFLYINQVPSEHVLINKDLLAVLCRRCNKDKDVDSDSLQTYPEWLPTTYNMLLELPQFISYFQNRNKKNLDNTWICKPFNLARGLEICITDNLNHIIRLSETRPMVACKYITDPVLFPDEGKGLVKMDLRFIVLLRSMDPLELYVYERFWLRFANKPFSLNDFDDYEKHFTVMNYGSFPLQQMYCQDFIKKFEAYYSNIKWSDIQESIYKMIKEIFVASTMKAPPAGVGSFPGSRAMYGLDVMLRWNRENDAPSIVPMILEVNWMPDCKRACQYYSDFYNDIYSVLFLGEDEGKHVVKL